MDSYATLPNMKILKRREQRAKERTRQQRRDELDRKRDELSELVSEFWADFEELFDEFNGLCVPAFAEDEDEGEDEGEGEDEDEEDLEVKPDTDDDVACVLFERLKASKLREKNAQAKIEALEQTISELNSSNFKLLSKDASWRESYEQIQKTNRGLLKEIEEKEKVIEEKEKVIARYTPCETFFNGHKCALRKYHEGPHALFENTVGCRAYHYDSKYGLDSRTAEQWVCTLPVGHAGQHIGDCSKHPGKRLIWTPGVACMILPKEDADNVEAKRD